MELRGSRGRGSSSSRALLTSLLASPVGFMAGFHALPARGHKGGSKERQEDIARQTTNNESNERSLLGYWPLERTHKVIIRHKAYLYLPPARAPLRGPLPPGPAVACGRGALVKSVKLGSPPQDFPRNWTCRARVSSRPMDLSGDPPMPMPLLTGKYLEEVPWFLCASALKFHARGPLSVKEIAINYGRWEGRGSLCSLKDADRDFPSFPIDTPFSFGSLLGGGFRALCIF